ncbi:MAG: hypothetical protein ACPG5B_03110 [Chitinophagales bacterium]
MPTVPGLVWPGDADDNGTVNMVDLLSIGLKYGTTGSHRDSISITFNGKNAQSWSGKLPNNTNDKNIDCNGNGTINVIDTTAISRNFNLTHPNSNVSFKTTGQASVTLNKLGNSQCNPPKPDCTAVTWDMILNNPQSLYGISLFFNYSEDVTINSTKLTSSCLGKEGVDFINMIKNDSTNNQLNIGLTRIKPSQGDVPCSSIGNITMEVMEFDGDIDELLTLNVEETTNIMSLLQGTNITFLEVSISK